MAKRLSCYEVVSSYRSSNTTNNQAVEGYDPGITPNYQDVSKTWPKRWDFLIFPSEKFWKSKKFCNWKIWVKKYIYIFIFFSCLKSGIKNIGGNSLTSIISYFQTVLQSYYPELTVQASFNDFTINHHPYLWSRADKYLVYAYTFEY